MEFNIDTTTLDYYYYCKYCEDLAIMFMNGEYDNFVCLFMDLHTGKVTTPEYQAAIIGMATVSKLKLHQTRPNHYEYQLNSHTYGPVTGEIIYVK